MIFLVKFDFLLKYHNTFQHHTPQKLISLPNEKEIILGSLTNNVCALLGENDAHFSY